MISEESPAIVTTFDFLRDALRLRWRVWVGAAILGLACGLAWSALIGSARTATTSLFLSHPEGTEKVTAMQTDIAVLRTRTVASRTIAAGGLQMTADELFDLVDAEATSDSVLTITVRGRTPTGAVHLADTLATEFLQFRNDQLQTQADALVDGYRSQVSALESKAARLSTEYRRLSASTSNNDKVAATDVLADRARTQDQIGTLTQSIEATQLAAASVREASHVLDPAGLTPRSAAIQMGLAAASGTLAGLWIGAGAVIIGALTSNRLRRRDEIAAAIRAPVTYATADARGRRVDALARGIQSALSTHPHLVVTYFGHDTVAVRSCVAASLDLRRDVLLVDLSRSGRVQRAVNKASYDRDGGLTAILPAVLRPPTALTPGPLATADPRQPPGWCSTSITIVPMDLNAGFNEMRTWGTGVLIMVAAGECSAELIAGAADLLRSAGLDLVGALMTGTDSTDESTGLPPPAANLDHRIRETG